MNAQVETFQVEKSYEATTLDYLNPLWYTVGEPFTTEAEAQAKVDALYTEARESGSEPVAFRYKRIAPQAEVDALLEAEFAFQRRYWADRAAEAARQQEALQRILDLKGQVVRVVKGRKVALGTEGTVFWVGEGKYDGYRVGMKTESGETHWTAVSNVAPVAELVGA